MKTERNFAAIKRPVSFILLIFVFFSFFAPNFEQANKAQAAPSKEAIIKEIQDHFGGGNYVIGAPLTFNNTANYEDARLVLGDSNYSLEFAPFQKSAAGWFEWKCTKAGYENVILRVSWSQVSLTVILTLRLVWWDEAAKEIEGINSMTITTLNNREAIELQEWIEKNQNKFPEGSLTEALTGFDDPFNALFEKLGGFINKGIESFMDLIAWALTSDTQVAQTEELREVWNVTRSAANIMFVLGILIIAFTNVAQIQMDAYTLRSLIPRFIVAVILVNGSLIISQVIIDLANALTYFFLGGGTPEGAGILLGKLFVGASALSFTPVGILSLLFLLGVFLANLMLLLALITRIILVWLLVVISPIAFMFMVLPFTRKMHGTWWTNFVRWVFMAPIVALFLKLGVTMLDSLGGDASTPKIQMILPAISNFAQTYIAGPLALVWHKIVPVALAAPATTATTDPGVSQYIDTTIKIHPILAMIFVIAIFVAAAIVPLALGGKIMGSVIGAAKSLAGKAGKAGLWGAGHTKAGKNLAEAWDRRQKMLQLESQSNIAAGKGFTGSLGRAMIGQSGKEMLDTDLLKKYEGMTDQQSQTEIKEATMVNPGEVLHENLQFDRAKLAGISDHKLAAMAMKWAGMDDMEGHSLGMFANELADRGQWNMAFAAYQEARSARPTIAGDGEVLDEKGNPDLFHSKEGSVAGFLDRYYGERQRIGGNTPGRAAHTRAERLKRFFKPDKIAKSSYVNWRPWNDANGLGLTAEEQATASMGEESIKMMSDKVYESAMGGSGGGGQRVMRAARHIYNQSHSVEETIKGLDALAEEQRKMGGSVIMPDTGKSESFRKDHVGPDGKRVMGPDGEPLKDADSDTNGFAHWERWDETSKRAFIEGRYVTKSHAAEAKV